jgi:hypothetical protein
MLSPRNIVVSFVIVCAVFTAAVHGHANSHIIRSSVITQDNSVRSLLERIRLKLKADQSKYREDQHQFKLREQQIRRELRLAVIERSRANETVRDASTAERSALQDLCLDRSNPFLKTVALEWKFGGKEAEKRFDTALYRETQLQAKLAGLLVAEEEIQEALTSTLIKIEEFAQLETRVMNDMKMASDSDQLYRVLEDESRAVGLKSSVLFKSVNPGLQETTGATVRYITSVQRQYKVTPNTAKCLTSCTDELEINFDYYIWTERDGRKTSTEYRVSLSKAKEEVVLKEDRSN